MFFDDNDDDEYTRVNWPWIVKEWWRMRMRRDCLCCRLSKTHNWRPEVHCHDVLHSPMASHTNLLCVTQTTHRQTTHIDHLYVYITGSAASRKQLIQRTPCIQWDFLNANRYNLVVQLFCIILSEHQLSLRGMINRYAVSCLGQSLGGEITHARRRVTLVTGRACRCSQSCCSGWCERTVRVAGCRHTHCWL